MTYQLVKATTNGEWQDYHAIRRSVLWEARGDSTYDDKHPAEHLPDNHPLLLKWGNHFIGTVRLDDLGNEMGVVRLVAIATDLQGRGHGRELEEQVENYAQQLGLKTLYTNAAPEALGYYKKLGWILFEWDPAELTGIAADCIQMRRLLQPL